MNNWASLLYPFLVAVTVTAWTDEPMTIDNPPDRWAVIGTNFSAECGRGTFFSYSRNGKTYAVWPGPGMSPQIRMIDEAMGKLSPVVQIGTLDYTYSGAYHGYPSMVVGTEGTVHVFLNKHVQQMHYYRSSPGGDPTAPWKETIFSEAAGYPFSIVTESGRIYIFSIHNMDPKYVHPRRPLYFRRSDDNGLTWTEPVKCMDWDLDDMQELYVGAIRLEPAQGKFPERINVVLTLAGRGGHNKCHKDIFYAYMDAAMQTMHDVRGADLGECVQGREEWDAIRVVDTGDSYSRPFAVQHTHNVVADRATGYPLVGYEPYETEAKKICVMVRAWEGSTWGVPVKLPWGSVLCEMIRDSRGLVCYTRDGGVVYGFAFDPAARTFAEAGSLQIDGLPISSFRLTGGTGGYELARFVFHERYDDIHLVDARFRVGIYNGK